MKYNKDNMIGKPTEEECRFTDFLLDGIHYYVSKNPTDRRVLIAAISRISMIVFCDETPYDVKQQCAEINDFCEFLKNHALKNSVR